MPPSDTIPVPPDGARFRCLRAEREDVRAELARLRSAGPLTEDAPAARRALERRLGQIDRELERLELAAEVERQSDA